MKNVRFANAHHHIFLLGTSILIAFFTSSCSTSQSRATDVIEKHLKDRGAIEVKSDFFYTNAKFPGKAFVSVTATFNFASAQGTNHQEFLGFVLAQESEGWKIETSTAYTTDEQKAVLYLTGKKR
ncbi:MAG: hypothetical protein L0229_26080 [Blastocatellia bacterium]|nr:hypothetical protein [Blastocatellia bacterium]